MDDLNTIVRNRTLAPAARNSLCHELSDLLGHSALVFKGVVHLLDRPEDPEHPVPAAYIRAILAHAVDQIDQCEDIAQILAESP